MSDLRLLKSVLISAIILFMMFDDKAAIEQSTPADKVDVGSLVITARKREESILMTPVTISAITAKGTPSSVAPISAGAGVSMSGRGRKH